MVDIATLLDDVAADLLTTNELGDGTRDYREVDGVVFLDIYEEDGEFDDEGIPIPSRTFRVDFQITET